MEGLIKTTAGIFLVLMGLGYLYRPSGIIRANAVARVLLFNDAHLLHYRRTRGLLIFLAGVVLLYSGFLNISFSVPRPPTNLEDGYRAFYERRYSDAADIAGRVLAESPNNPHADFLFRQARMAARRGRTTR